MTSWLIWLWDALLVALVFVALAFAVPAHLEGEASDPVALLEDGSLPALTDEELARMDGTLWP